MNEKRSLSRIVSIDSIEQIEGADNIALAKIGGWGVIVDKGDFKVGEKAIFFEIDSIIPEIDGLDFLRKKCFKPDIGYCIKTYKLNKFNVISQGILLPLSILPLDLDLTDAIGVKLREDFEIETNGTKQAGNFPHFIPKTSCVRVQNVNNITHLLNSDKFYSSVKLDGSSATYYNNINYECAICSRNFQLKPEDSGIWGEIESKYKILSKISDALVHFGEKSIAIQGEIIGSGVNSNRHKYKEGVRDFFIFSIYFPERFEYAGLKYLESISEFLGIKTVPILDKDYKAPETIDLLIDSANGTVDVGNGGLKREGICIRKTDTIKLNSVDSIYKVISNDYLLQHKI